MDYEGTPDNAYTFSYDTNLWLVDHLTHALLALVPVSGITSKRCQFRGYDASS